MPRINLPEMPIAGIPVSNELEDVCKPQSKCKNINNWLNELYTFRQKYNVYKQELSK